MDLVRYRFLDSVTNYLQCGDVKLRLVPLACLNGGRFDRLRAPVTVTGRRVSSQPWCLRLKGSGPTASTGAASSRFPRIEPVLGSRYQLHPLRRGIYIFGPVLDAFGLQPELVASGLRGWLEAIPRRLSP